MCVEAAPGSAMARNLAPRSPLAASLSHLATAPPHVVLDRCNLSTRPPGGAR